MTQPPIGIDLGTTNSLIAVFRNGRPELIPNALGEILTPSVVSVDEDTVLVGRAARDRLATHPDCTAAAFKRSMGTDTRFRLGKQKFRAEDLSALLLRKLKEDAEAQLGQPIEDVVVTVPAYFNQVQRQATLTACAMAGLVVRRLVNEPTAAALAYGLQDRDGESQFLVFDLGGGTFDVTLLEHFDGVMQVKASSGDAFLGGEDFSAALAHAMAESLKRPWSGLGADMQRQLRLMADNAKRHLSIAHSHEVSLRDGDREIKLVLGRADFEKACQPLLQRLYRPIERCLYASDERAETLDRVILVGGATRMPMIRQLVARQFKMMPEMTIDPDHAVALGAAVQAGLVAEDRGLQDVVMTDVSPFSVGIATGAKLNENQILDGFFEPIIERNTALPASREEVFTTLVDNQTKIVVSIFQGEAPKVEDNVHLGEFRVNIPKGRAGAESIAVRITYDSSGLIEVEGRSLTTGRAAGTIIKQNADGLSEAEIAARLKAMAKLKLHPRHQEENTAFLARIRRVHEMSIGEDRNEIRNMLIAFEAALARQDTSVIDRLRGEMGEALNRVDDYYVS